MWFEVNGTLFIGDDNGEFTVSGAALFLLRTLEADHTVDSPVTEGNLLFPCCGFNVRPISAQYPVLVLGCPNGVDVEVLRHGGKVELRCGELKASADWPEWEAAVKRFASEVKAFYETSAPRNPPPDGEDREGWTAFWSEWEKRFGAQSN